MGQLKPPDLPPPDPHVVPAWPGTYAIVTQPEPELVPVVAFVIGYARPVVPGSGAASDASNNDANDANNDAESNVVDFAAAKAGKATSGNDNAAGRPGSCSVWERPGSLAITGAITPLGGDATYDAYWLPGGTVAYRGEIMTMSRFLELKGLEPGTFSITE